MKKRTMVLIVSGVLLIGLLGCSKKNTYEEKDAAALNTLNKAQKIEQIDVKSNKIINTIKKTEDIETFVENLDLDDSDWKIDFDMPDNLEEKYIYRYYIAPTIKDGEENKKQELEKVLDLVTYKDKNYVQLRMGEVSLSFKAPKGVITNLNK